MATRRFIPETPDALTANWLNEVLHGAAPVDARSVQAVEQRTLGEGEGFVGDILRLTLQLDDGETASLIAKLPKLENRTIGELLGAYEREIMFYQSFAVSLPIRSPKLYYADFDRDRGSENQEPILRKMDALPRWTNSIVAKLGRMVAAGKKRRYILLIEDVGHAEPGNQLNGADRDRCSAVLRETAKLHAKYWNHPSLTDSFWLLPMDVDVRMRHTMAVDARPAFEALFPDVAKPLAPFLDEGTATGVALTQSLAAGPTTLLHYDLRLDNLMFDADGVIFIDWQLTRRGHPAYDVAYFLSSAVEDSDSALSLLEDYHHALVENGISDYPLNQFLADYKTALRVVLMGLSTVDQVNVGSGRGMNMLKVWMSRLAQRLTADQ